MHQTSVQKCKRITNKLEEIKGGNGMLKKMKKRLNNEKGLTLVELLAVVVILGIISAIAIPAIGGIINNSEDKAIMSDAVNIINAAKLANTAGDCIATKATATDAKACNQTTMSDYIEGTNGDFHVQYDESANVWNVTYDDFENLNKNYNGIDLAKKDYTISENDLEDNLN